MEFVEKWRRRRRRENLGEKSVRERMWSEEMKMSMCACLGGADAAAYTRPKVGDIFYFVLIKVKGRQSGW